MVSRTFDQMLMAEFIFLHHVLLACVERYKTSKSSLVDYPDHNRGSYDFINDRKTKPGAAQQSQAARDSRGGHAGQLWNLSEQEGRCQANPIGTYLVRFNTCTGCHGSPRSPPTASSPQGIAVLEKMFYQQ